MASATCATMPGTSAGTVCTQCVLPVGLILVSGGGGHRGWSGLSSFVRGGRISCSTGDDDHTVTLVGSGGSGEYTGLSGLCARASTNRGLL
jgi:hypothetical protein